MRRRALALIALAVTLSACSLPMTGAPPSPTPAATVTPSPTPTPIPSPTVVNGQIVVSNLDPDGAAVVAGILFPPTGGSCGANGSRQFLLTLLQVQAPGFLSQGAGAPMMT